MCVLFAPQSRSPSQWPGTARSSASAARFTAGGEGNPLGARAIYLGNTMYRIHGTNAPATIGTKVSSGCIRLLNTDVIDLYSRVTVSAKIIVLRNRAAVAAIAAPARASLPQTYDMRPSNIY
jgi:lipoprotein-anchoring transpeptidase ErfK/SrfK